MQLWSGGARKTGSRCKLALDGLDDVGVAVAEREGGVVACEVE
jgi:hypothetical protein